MIFRARQFEFTFPRPTLIMGIVNVTPDSFSDAGESASADEAVAHSIQLIKDGADIIDVGGESTRPEAIPVSLKYELDRVIPVIESLHKHSPKIPISIDTQKAEVAEAAVSVGASIINDVAANRSDVKMWEVAAATGAGYVAMHMQGNPQTMQREPKYADVVAEVAEFFEERLSLFQKNGIQPECIVLDVGIGFGKSVAQNLQLLAALSSFQKFDRPLLLGASRKSFIGSLTGANAKERLPGSLATATLAVSDGVQIVRVHDVAATHQALQVTNAILGQRGSNR